jgi:hypothetical protein
MTTLGLPGCCLRAGVSRRPVPGRRPALAPLLGRTPPAAHPRGGGGGGGGQGWTAPVLLGEVTARSGELWGVQAGFGGWQSI